MAPGRSLHPRGVADALATITPSLLTPHRDRPPAAILRSALYGHAFNPARARTDPGPAATAALAWARHHCLPLAALLDPDVTRRALDALALRLDGTRAAAAAAATIRKRAVFHGCLGYAAELGLLEANPLDRISWQPPRSPCPAGPQSAATPAEVQTVLAEVTRICPELTAFFGCLYYAALRPAEAVALHATSCTLPASGWGQLTLTGSLPRSARAWTGNGTPREPRGLKHRPGGGSRTVPIPPQLVQLLHHHLHTYGSAADGRLFQGVRGGPPSESRYGRIWHQARSAAATPGAACLRPYDPRHAALSLWLASGAPPAEVAARAGHSVRVLLATYAHRIPAATRSPASTSTGPSTPATGPRWPTRAGADPRNPVRHTSVPQLDSTGHSWT